MKNVLFTLLFVVVLIGCTDVSPENCNLSEHDIANINDLIELHEKYTLEGDWKADALLYDEEAIRFPPGGTPIKGIEAIQKDLEAVKSVSTFTHEIEEINGGGNIAYLIVNYEFEGIPVGSNDAFKVSGKSMTILKRQNDDSWKFYKVMWY